MKTVKFRGNQGPFVRSEMRYPFYIGGVGSGKTFSGIVRGIQYSQQAVPEGRLWGPRGCCLAGTYPILLDVVVPEFFEVIEGTGLLKNYEKSRKIAHLHSKNCPGPKRGGKCCPDALVLFRSLDRPQWARGLNLSWFFVDEGRHVDLEAFNVLVARLRQPGYEHSGWVTSTPDGFNWMWELAHEDSPYKLGNAEWFQASTMDNADNLDPDFIADIQSTYKIGSPLYRQEVLGEFVGLMKGAVFEEWNPSVHVTDVPYRSDLPLYSSWDFGIGDIGCVIFAQVEFFPHQIAGQELWLPTIRLIDYLEATNRNGPDWATEFKNHCMITYGRMPDANYGDPAGKGRGPSGLSWFDELRSHGVHVIPVDKKAPDYAIHIIRTIMARDGVICDKTRASRLGQALGSHRWNTDDQGNRIGKEPVHDWTSHPGATIRYLVAGRPDLHHFPRKSPKQESKLPPGSAGDIQNQILNRHRKRGLMPSTREHKPTWRVPVLGGVNGT